MGDPKTDQKKVKTALLRKYVGAIKHLSVMISPSVSIEKSCRSRSFMFLSIATVVADYAKCSVSVPENGSVSLNYPLSPSRRGACSTRTTHPVFIQRYQDVLQCLGIDVKVFNPYEFYTKGEVVQMCANKEFLLQIAPISNSCGKRNTHQQMYDNRNATHCRCMPCMYRKAALLGEHDGTTYGNKLKTIFNKRKAEVSKDFFAMLDFLKQDFNPKQIRSELEIDGMIGYSNIDDYVDLIIRTREELARMLRAENSNVINRYMGWV